METGVMMFLRVVVLTSLMTALWPVASAAQVALPGTTDEVHLSFNKTADALDMPQRLRKMDCKRGKAARTCTYQLGFQDSVISASAGHSNALSSVSVLLSSPLHPKHFAAVTHIVMSTYSPNASPEAINKAVSHFRQALEKRLSDSKFVLGETYYQLLGDPDFLYALIVSAESE